MRVYGPTEDAADRLPQAMIETTTEFDWDELPVYIKGVIRHAADEFQRWAAQQENPIVGEVVPDAGPALPQADLRPHIKAVEAAVAGLRP